MSTFTKFSAELDLRYNRGGGNWIVLTPFTYYVGTKGSDTRIDIPVGFVTDGASVPRPFWNIIPPWGLYGQAAVVHDFLCEHLFVLVDGKPMNITRKRADEIFLEAMGVLGVPLWKRTAMYEAVRAYSLVSSKH